MRRLIPIAAFGALGIAAACSSFDASEVPRDPAEGGATSEASIESGILPDAAMSDSAVPPGACMLGTSPSTVATITGPASKLQTNDEDLFWIEADTNLVRASLADCATKVMATGNITALAVDSKWVVWNDAGYHMLERGKLSDPPKTLALVPGATSLIAASTLYWLQPANVVACEMPCVSSTNANFVESPKLLAANAFRWFVFAQDSDSGTTGDLFYQSATLVGNDVLVGPLVTGQAPIALAASSTHVYWINAGGQLAGLPAGGGTPLTMPKVAGALHLAADASNVYVATATTIVRVPAVGGAGPSVMAVGESDIRTLNLTNDAVVWGTATAIRRMSKN